MKSNIPNLEYSISKMVVSLLRKPSTPDQLCTIEEIKRIIAEPLAYLHELTMVEHLTDKLDNQNVLRALEECGFVVEGGLCRVDQMSKFQTSLLWGQRQLDYWHERMEKGFH